MNNEKIKEEINNLFNRIYSGVDYPKISEGNVLYFVDKALKLKDTIK